MRPRRAAPPCGSCHSSLFPVAWILIAATVAAGNRLRAIVVAAMVGIVAVGFALTGNRSPAFAAIETGLIAALLAARRDRLGVRGIGLLATAGVVLVVGAGLFGAFRLASRDIVYGPPVPNATSPDYAALTAIAIKGYLVVPIRNLGYVMDAVPERIAWRSGITYIQPIATILPGKQTTFDADLKSALNQRYAGGGTVPGLLGEAYANFGSVGWFIVPFLVAVLITVLYRITRGGAPEHAALYAYAVPHVSIGAALSGLAVASIFPYEAYAVLGFAVVGLPHPLPPAAPPRRDLISALTSASASHACSSRRPTGTSSRRSEAARQRSGPAGGRRLRG